MHLHLTHAEILLVSFALSVAVIIAVAAVLQFWEERKPPFLNYFETPYGRNLVGSSSSSDMDNRIFGRPNRLEPLRASSVDSKDWRYEVTGKPRRNRL